MQYKTAKILYAYPPTDEQVKFLIAHLKQMRDEIKWNLQNMLFSFFGFKLDVEFKVVRDGDNIKIFYLTKPDNLATKKVLEYIIERSAVAGNATCTVVWGPMEEWVEEK